MSKAAQDHQGYWDEKFRSRDWGRYPPEDLVRFMGRSYAGVNHSKISVLEVGCGPGANLWFLHREGYKVYGIDISPAAIEKAGKRLAEENKGLNRIEPDLRVGNFSALPWEDDSFDTVIDIFAIYANTLDVIKSVTGEIHRVLKSGGLFYTKLWGCGCTGYGEGTEVEPGTYTDIPSGPCQDMGISHFFSREEIEQIFSNFEAVAIDMVKRTDVLKNQEIEEYVCQFKKP